MMSSVAQYLMDNVMKTVVVIGETRKEIENLSNDILRKYIGMGGTVSSAKLFQYILNNGLNELHRREYNKLYFFVKTNVEIKLRGMSIDRLLFSYRVDQMSALNNIRANLASDGGIGILFPAPGEKQMEVPF